jgi:hypothetical protein
MQTAHLLTERSFDDLLIAAVTARRVGLVMLRDREGARHGAWIDDGYVVGVHIAGHFDPLLALLCRRGALSPSLRRLCLARLAGSSERAGAVASLVAGITQSEVRDALRSQLVQRFGLLRELAVSSGHDARLEPGPVPPDERSLRMPLGSLLRRVQARAAPAPQSERPLLSDQPDRALPRDGADARRALRELARQLHPDLHPALNAEERARRERELSRATAAYHGFR